MVAGKLLLADETQKAQRDHLTYEAWGDMLTLEQFLDREQKLRSHAWARQNMQTWLWQDPNGIASCETFKMQGLRGNIYAIASVYTSFENRKKGLATTLLEAVHHHIQKIDSQVQAFMLFSEVGAGIYGRLGYEPQPSFERVFQATDCDAVSLSSPNKMCRAEWEKMWSLTPQRPEEQVLIWPNVDHFDWHWLRQDLYARYLSRTRSDRVGAVFRLQEEATQSMSVGGCISWAADFKINSLRVLWLRASAPVIAEHLIASALSTARSLGLETVRIWESEEFQNWNQIRRPNERVPRPYCLSMIRSGNIDAGSFNVISRVSWV